MDCSGLHNGVLLPTYSIVLIGVTISFLFITVIALVIVLYLALKKKSIFGLNANNKQYVRQESTGVTPIYNNKYDEDNKNNGSTHSVNSDSIDRSKPRTSDPITPTRLEDAKIIFAKKPIKPTLPLMHRGQMDEICKEVLRKVQKSDSASFRDLNELLKFEKKEDNFGMQEETVKEVEQENLESDVRPYLFKLKKKQNKTEAPNEIKTETKGENKNETKNQTSETEPKVKPNETKDIRIEINNVESDKNDDDSDETEYDTVPNPIIFRHSHPEPDQTLYDSVPSPTRYRHSGPEPDHYDRSEYDTVPRRNSYRNSGLEPNRDELDDIPLYDLPPSRSYDEPARNIIQMDLETNYLMPFSEEKTDSCYVNAKRK